MASRILKVKRTSSQLPPLHIGNISESTTVIGKTKQYYAFNNCKFPYPPFQSNCLVIKGYEIDKKNEFVPEKDNQDIEIIDWSSSDNIYVKEGGSINTLWLLKFNEPGKYDVSLVYNSPPYSSIIPCPTQTLKSLQYNFNISDVVNPNSGC